MIHGYLSSPRLRRPRRTDGTLFGIFRRNLVVTDSDLLGEREPSGEKTLRLRGRDLRYAKLDRTDFSGARSLG